MLTLVFADFGGKAGPQIETTIKEDGTITLPNNKQVQAANKTIVQLEKDLRYVFSEPRDVTVTLSAHGPSVYVDGAVKKPGWYRYYTNMTVLEATAMAGGFTASTAKHKVQLVRANGKTFLIDAAKAQQKPELNLEVFPGDRVHVPQRLNAASTHDKVFDVHL